MCIKCVGLWETAYETALVVEFQGISSPTQILAPFAYETSRIACLVSAMITAAPFHIIFANLKS